MPDKRLNDWWVENPFLIAAKGKSLSGYERNRLFWNVAGDEFLEISGISNGTDSDGDARAAVAADLNNDGRQDLIVRQAGGGPFLMFENHFPKAHWLQVSLRASQDPRGAGATAPSREGERPRAPLRSTSRGIGARVIAHVGSRKVVRELFPANSFVSQAPDALHFGLATATHIDRLEIRWPSGRLQSLSNLVADQHLKITEAE